MRVAGNRRREQGVVIVWLALFLLLMLCFVAVGVDVAKLMATHTELQNAADAAALAGASAINPTTGNIIAATAVQRVQTTAQSNKAFINDDQPVIVATDDIEVTAKTVKVTVRRQGDESVVTHFAQVLGIQTLATSANATAKVDTANGAECGIVPLSGVPLNPGQTFSVGQVYQLKLGAGSSIEGNFYALDFPACEDGPCKGLGPSGANTYRCLLANGYCCKIEVGQVLNTETGNMSGPTKTAMDSRFNADHVSAQNITYAQYLAMGGTGQRVVVVPLTTAPSGGKVTVTGFGSFFVKNRPGTGASSTIDGEFIINVAPGDIGGGGNGAILLTPRLIE
jgi:Flp pilus assembly protein TadG